MSRIVITVLTWLAVAAAAAAVIYGIFWVYETWRASVYEEGERAGAARIQHLWDADSTERGKERAEAVLAARIEEAEAAAEAAQGETHARERAEAQAARNAAAARQSAAAAGSLRDDLAALDQAARAAGVPDAASCPTAFAEQREQAIRARSILGACAAEHRQLAEDADRTLADLQLRLDTALSWIRATGAAGAAEIR
jgi:hypothetical protein